MKPRSRWVQLATLGVLVALMFVGPVAAAGIVGATSIPTGVSFCSTNKDAQLAKRDYDQDGVPAFYSQNRQVDWTVSMWGPAYGPRSEECWVIGDFDDDGNERVPTLSPCTPNGGSTFVQEDKDDDNLTAVYARLVSNWSVSDAGASREASPGDCWLAGDSDDDGVDRGATINGLLVPPALTRSEDGKGYIVIHYGTAPQVVSMPLPDRNQNVRLLVFLSNFPTFESTTATLEAYDVLDDLIFRQTRQLYIEGGETLSATAFFEALPREGTLYFKFCLGETCVEASIGNARLNPCDIAARDGDESGICDQILCPQNQPLGICQPPQPPPSCDVLPSYAPGCGPICNLSALRLIPGQCGTPPLCDKGDCIPCPSVLPSGCEPGDVDPCGLPATYPCGDSCGVIPCEVILENPESGCQSPTCWIVPIQSTSAPYGTPCVVVQPHNAAGSPIESGPDGFAVADHVLYNRFGYDRAFTYRDVCSSSQDLVGAGAYKMGAAWYGPRQFTEGALTAIEAAVMYRGTKVNCEAQTEQHRAAICLRNAGHDLWLRPRIMTTIPYEEVGWDVSAFMTDPLWWYEATYVQNFVFGDVDKVYLNSYAQEVEEAADECSVWDNAAIAVTFGVFGGIAALAVGATGATTLGAGFVGGVAVSAVLSSFENAVQKSMCEVVNWIQTPLDGISGWRGNGVDMAHRYDAGTSMGKQFELLAKTEVTMTSCTRNYEVQMGLGAEWGLTAWRTTNVAFERPWNDQMTYVPQSLTQSCESDDPL